MISLSADEVERRFVLLGIPNRFSQTEKTDLATTSIVSDDPDVMAFPIPKAKGLPIGRLMRFPIEKIVSTLLRLSQQRWSE